MSAVPDILSGPREQKSELGFWVYLMTDCVLFGSLFATYAVLRNNTFGGPGGADIFNMPLILISTLILLTFLVSMVLKNFRLSRLLMMMLSRQ